MTELDRTNPDRDDAKDRVKQTPKTYGKGDVLHPEWGERPPWFGYIGVGIAIFALLAGIALMVLTASYAWKWIGS